MKSIDNHTSKNNNHQGINNNYQGIHNNNNNNNNNNNIEVYHDNNNNSSSNSYHDGCIETDWLCIYTVNELIDPFKIYLEMSSLENKVYQLRRYINLNDNNNNNSHDNNINSSHDNNDDDYHNSINKDTTARSNITSSKLLDPTRSLLDPTRSLLDPTISNTSIFIDPTTPNQSKLIGLSVPSGWCSWYHFYEKISEQDLIANLNGKLK